MNGLNARIASIVCLSLICSWQGVLFSLSEEQTEKTIHYVSGEEFPHWRHWTNENGLPSAWSGFVNSDPFGNIFISQTNHFIRYDGYAFHEFPSQIVTSRIYQNRDKQIWSPYVDGLNILEGSSFTTHTLLEFFPEYETEFPFRERKIISLKKDFFLLVSDSRLVAYDAKSKSATVVQYATDSPLNRFDTIHTDYTHSIWIFGDNGAVEAPVVDGQWNRDSDWNYHPYPGNHRNTRFSEAQIIPGTECVVTVSIDENAGLSRLYHFKNGEWNELYEGNFVSGCLGHDGGFWTFHYDEAEERHKLSYHYSGDVYEMRSTKFNRNIFDIHYSPDGSIWTTSPNGVSRYSPPVWRTDVSYDFREKILFSGFVQSPTEQWVLSRTHISRKQNGTWNSIALPEDYPISFFHFNSLQQMDEESVLVVSGKSAYIYNFVTKAFQQFPHPGMDETFMHEFIRMPNGVLLCGTRYERERYTIELFDFDSTVTLFDFQESNPDNVARSILQDSQGGIWFSTKQGLYQLEDGSAKMAEHLMQSISGIVNYMHERNNGNLLIVADHVYEYDGTEMNILVNNVTDRFGSINHVIEDEHDQLWLSANNGVHRYQDGALVANTFDDGLVDDRYNFLMMDDDSGQVFAGSRNGLSVFHATEDTDPPETYIPTDRNFNDFTHVSDIRFEVSGVDKWNYTKRDRLLYSFRIDDGEWSPYQEGNDITVSDSGAGTYTLHVRSMDRNFNVDPTPATFRFTINPPWYLQSAFLIWSALASVLTLIFAYYAVRNYYQLKFSLLQTKQTVSLLERTQERLTRAKTSAEAANKAKDGFLARMSHEIRTPLHGILGNLELVDMTNQSQKDSKIIRTAIMSANTLMEIIGDVLEFAKIEADKLTLHEKPTNLHQLFEETISVMKVRAEQKNLLLEGNLNDDVPSMVLIDPVRARQVMINLIGNGIKFTDQGSVIVSIESSGNERIVFEVNDTGIGFDPSRKEQLFREFEQDSTSKRTDEGTGLGLAICKRIIEMMGGIIDCESYPKKGSRFWFDIPVQVIQRSDPSHAEMIQRSTRKTFKLDHPVLVVDDTLSMRELSKNQLNQLGMECVTVASGEVALSQFEHKQFAFALVDCSMPDMDGFELSRRIRVMEEGSKRRLPIIALTAHVVSGIREQCLQAGMDHYLSKPLRLDDLSDMVEKCLPHSVSITNYEKDESYEAESQSKSMNGELAPIDLEGLKSFTQLYNSSDLNEFLSFSVNDLDHALGKMSRSIQEEDRKGFVDSAHTIKGIAVSIKANPILTIATKLNQESPRMHWDEANQDFMAIQNEMYRLRLYLKDVFNSLNPGDDTHSES